MAGFETGVYFRDETYPRILGIRMKLQLFQQRSIRAQRLRSTLGMFKEAVVMTVIYH